MMLATGLVLSLFATSVVGAGAFHDDDDDIYNPGGYYDYDPDCDPAGNSQIIDGNLLSGYAMAHQFFPWVPNGTDDMDGMGPFYGTVTVQNLMPWDIEVDLFTGTGVADENWDFAGTLNLEPNESQTQTASALDIPSGEGASVIAIGWTERPSDDDDEDEDCDDDGEYARIAGVVKNVNPVVGPNAKTTTAHSIVDGYSGLSGYQISDFSGNSAYILPIVQSNSGWDTEVRVANFDEDGNTAQNITVDLFPADNQGYGGPAEQVLLNVPAGGVGSFLVSDIMGDGWVGSAYIQSGSLTGAVAERFKVEDSMLVTNSSRPEHEGDDEHYAALVFKGYNFWNTGISIANLSDTDNHVTISYYGPTNNVVGTESLTIPPRAMEFVHTPGWQDLGFGPQGGFVGSAIITSTNGYELMAAVDQIKYFGDDPDVGQAMSYVTDGQNVNEADGSGEALAMPLIQKGSTLQGTGDTSGVQLFNTDDDDETDIEIQFYTANGNPAAPTVNAGGGPQPMILSISAHSSYTLYTHNFSEMPGNFQGSVIAYAESGEMVGVSNNVNYAVDGDGSVAFPMIVDPYWFPEDFAPMTGN
jgi:hypothetical protein